MNERMKNIKNSLKGVYELKDQMLDVNQYLFNAYLYKVLKDIVEILKELHPELNEKEIERISPEQHDKIMAESLKDVQISWRKRQNIKE